MDAQVTTPARPPQNRTLTVARAGVPSSEATQRLLSSYDQKLDSVSSTRVAVFRSFPFVSTMDVLEAIANRVSQAGDAATEKQAFQALSSKDLACDGPRALLARRGLGPALDQLGRSRDDPGGQATYRASYPSVQRAVRLGEVLTYEGQGAMIGDEEQRIQCTVSEDRCWSSFEPPERVR